MPLSTVLRDIRPADPERAARWFALRREIHHAMRGGAFDPRQAIRYESQTQREAWAVAREHRIREILAGDPRVDCDL